MTIPPDRHSSDRGSGRRGLSGQHPHRGRHHQQPAAQQHQQHPHLQPQRGGCRVLRPGAAPAGPGLSPQDLDAARLGVPAARGPEDMAHRRQHDAAQLHCLIQVTPVA